MSKSEGKTPDFPYTHLWVDSEGETHIKEARFSGFEKKSYAARPAISEGRAFAYQDSADADGHRELSGLALLPSGDSPLVVCTGGAACCLPLIHASPINSTACDSGPVRDNNQRQMAHQGH